MTESFDPYRKWLGIPPAEQPPNHYRLLGVGLFEDDADTIAIAADRQMAHIRTFQAGPNSALSQTLLNELAAARLVLLDAKKKAAYDDQLRAKLPESAPPGDPAGQGRLAPVDRPTPVPKPVAISPPPIISPTPVVPFQPPKVGQGRGADATDSLAFAVSDGATTPSQRSRARRSPNEPALWAGVAAAVAVLAAVIYVAHEGSKDYGLPADIASKDDALRSTQAKPHPLRDEDSASTQGSNAVQVDDSPTQPGDGLSSPAVADDMPPAVEPAPERMPANENVAQTTLGEGPKPAPEERPSLTELLSRGARSQLSTTRREAPPEGDTLTAAKGRFAQLHAKAIAKAKTYEAVRKLSFRFFNTAREASDTADARYVLLDASGSSAVKQGNVGLAYRAAAEVTRQFDVDPYSLKLKALEAAGKNATMPAANAVGALQALALAERAAAAGKNDLASKAADVAILLARKTNDKDLKAQVDQARTSLRQQSSRNTAYQKALIELKKLPEHPEANLSSGKYEVLVLGDWPAGLLKVAASGDPRWLAIAEGEALARADLSQLTPLASAWWQMAETEQDEFFQLQCRLQAKYCYLRARQTGRAGQMPVEIASQLRALPGYPMSRLWPGVAARYYEGERFGRQRAERIDPAIDFNFGEGSPDPTVPNGFFSARWTGFFKPPLRGRYLIVTYTDDSIRLWIDGEQVLDRWRQAARWQQVELELTPELHTIRMDYNDTHAFALAMLGWTLAAFPDADHVQWSPIDALYYDPESPFDLPELP